MIINKKRLIF